MTLHDAQMIDPKILEEYDKKHKDPATMDKSELLRLVYDLAGEKYQLEQELDKLKKDNSELEVDYHNVASTASLDQEKASQDTDIYEAYEAIRRQKASFKNSNIKPGRDGLVIVLLMAILLAMFIAVLFG